MSAFVYCEKCEKFTTTVEANARLFRQGRCGNCGGELLPAGPRSLAIVSALSRAQTGALRDTGVAAPAE